MIAPRYEYVVLLIVFAAAGTAIFAKYLPFIMRQRAYWLSAAAFVSLGIAIDILALTQGWWSWSDTRTCGLKILNVPVEEYGAFFIGHLSSVCAWEATRRDVA